MISGRIGFIADIVGLGLTGHRADRHARHEHHPLPPEHAVTDAVEAAATATPQTSRRHRLLALLKGTTF